MKLTQAYSLETLRAVQLFLEEHDGSLPGVSSTGARRKLDETIEALDEHAATQTGAHIAAQMSTRTQQTLELVLRRDHMTPIARIARAELPRTTELAALRLPRGRQTIDRLAALAGGMADVAEQHAEVFVEAGLPSDFGDRLRTAAREMVAARENRTLRRGDRAGATVGLCCTLSAGRRIVGVLDAFVQTVLADDPPLRSSWAAVKRVPAVAGSRVRPPVPLPRQPSPL